MLLTFFRLRAICGNELRLLGLERNESSPCLEAKGEKIDQARGWFNSSAEGLKATKDNIKKRAEKIKVWLQRFKKESPEIPPVTNAWWKTPTSRNINIQKHIQAVDQAQSKLLGYLSIPEEVPEIPLIEGLSMEETIKKVLQFLGPIDAYDVAIFRELFSEPKKSVVLDPAERGVDYFSAGNFNQGGEIEKIRSWLKEQDEQEPAHSKWKQRISYMRLFLFLMSSEGMDLLMETLVESKHQFDTNEGLYGQLVKLPTDNRTIPPTAQWVFMFIDKLSEEQVRNLIEKLPHTPTQNADNGTDNINLFFAGIQQRLHLSSNERNRVLLVQRLCLCLQSNETFMMRDSYNELISIEKKGFASNLILSQLFELSPSDRREVLLKLMEPAEFEAIKKSAVGVLFMVASWGGHRIKMYNNRWYGGIVLILETIVFTVIAFVMFAVFALVLCVSLLLPIFAFSLPLESDSGEEPGLLFRLTILYGLGAVFILPIMLIGLAIISICVLAIQLFSLVMQVMRLVYGFMRFLSRNCYVPAALGVLGVGYFCAATFGPCPAFISLDLSLLISVALLGLAVSSFIVGVNFPPKIQRKDEYIKTDRANAILDCFVVLVSALLIALPFIIPITSAMPHSILIFATGFLVFLLPILVKGIASVSTQQSFAVSRSSADGVVSLSKDALSPTPRACLEFPYFEELEEKLVGENSKLVDASLAS